MRIYHVHVWWRLNKMSAPLEYQQGLIRADSSSVATETMLDQVKRNNVENNFNYSIRRVEAHAYEIDFVQLWEKE